MAVIATNAFERFLTDYVLGASATVVPPSTWKVSMSPSAVGSMSRATVWAASPTGVNIQELGGGGGTSAFSGGMARQNINRDQTAAGWPAGTIDVSVPLSYKTTGAQVTFGPFSGAPSPNGAQSWELTDGTGPNTGVLYLAGDTAATRTFTAGDTEKVQPTVKTYSV